MRAAADIGRAGQLSLAALVGVTWLTIGDLPTTIQLGPISLEGMATIATGLACLLLFPMVWGHGRVRATPSSWPFLIPPGPRPGVVPGPLVLFSVIAVVGLLRQPSSDGVQNVLVYVAFVVLIGVTAVGSRAGTAARFAASVAPAMGLAALVAIPVFVTGQQHFWSARGYALTAMLGVATLVPIRPRNRLMGFVPYLLTVALACTLSRTALVTAILLLAFLVLRSRYGLRGFRVALALVVFALTVLVVFLSVPELRDRFLGGDNAVQVGGVALNTSGRADIWALVIDHAMQSPWIGWGAGSSEQVVTAAFGYLDINHPHNDYLRLWHDFGLVGLVPFLIGYLWLLLGAVRRALRTRRDANGVHWSAALALVSVGAAAITDNVLVYPFVMIPLGVIVGLSVGRRDVDPRVPPARRPDVARTGPVVTRTPELPARAGARAG